MWGLAERCSAKLHVAYSQHYWVSVLSFMGSSRKRSDCFRVSECNCCLVDGALTRIYVFIDTYVKYFVTSSGWWSNG